MPLPVWPTGLPSQPLKEGFSENEHQPLVVTPVEDGPDIMRVQSNTSIIEMAYPLYFTHAQFATFKTFVVTTLSKASSHFTMTVFVAPSTFENRRVYIKGGQWRPATPYRLGWIVRPVLCVFPTV